MRPLLIVLALMLAAPATAAATAGPRVVGGTTVPEGGFAAVANVSLAGQFSCTGTLVAPDWVLTAGHCGSLTSELLATPIAYPPFLIGVTLGTVHSDGSGGTSRRVTEVRIPSGHLALNTDTGYDVSLLHLDAPAPQAPVQLAGRGEESLWAPGHPETVVGFGLTTENGTAPARMQQATVPIVADGACKARYAGTFEAATQICAGYEKGGVDTCNGDSGGPMLAQGADHRLRIVGVTSYGDGCARPGAYGVYARVGDRVLREWVRSIVPAAVAADRSAAKAKKKASKKRRTAKHRRR